jgi:hypothetical protein
MPDVYHTVYLAAATQLTQLGTSLADSLAWQIHLPDAMADDTSLYQSENGGSYMCG